MDTIKHSKRLLTFLIFSLAFISSAQEEKNPWFYYERALPNDSIPVESYIDALDQQWDMRQNVGYSMSPQSAVWTSIGPSNENYTGRIVRVKYHPSNGNIIYICGNNGGVWKSTDGGTSFYPMCDRDYIQTQCSGDIAIDPQDPNTLYWGTGGSIAGWPWYNYYGIGVYKSTDAGNSWTGPLKNGLPSVIFTSTIVVNPSNRHIYLANCLGTGGFGSGSGGGLYKSTDGGGTWVRMQLQFQSSTEGVWDVVTSNDGQYVYTVSSTGCWRSTNYGASFFKLDTESGLFQSGRTQIAISKTDRNYVYVVSVYQNQTNYAFASTNGGSTFTRIQNLGSSYGLMSLDFIYVQASPIDPLVAFIGYGGGSAPVWRTTNGGQNWAQVTYYTDQNNFAFNPTNGNQALLCTDQGLYMSNNILNPGSVSFSNISYSLSLRQVFRVASNPI